MVKFNAYLNNLGKDFINNICMDKCELVQSKKSLKYFNCFLKETASCFTLLKK